MDNCKQSNLQCFLDSITPVVESRLLSKSSAKSSNGIWHRWGKEKCTEYYMLSDLWDSMYEWSAYGAGTDVRLPNGEMVVQYFVPYLSAIQLYTSRKNLSSSRSFGSHYEKDPYRYGDEYYNPMLSRSLSTLAEDSVLSKLDLGEKKKNLGELYFEYVEMSSPYTRIPLADKVHELAHQFPGLESLKSIELSPASWMSIAWYPIYHIPMQYKVKNLEACFLTYHSLSSSFQDEIHETLAVTPKNSPKSRNKTKQNDEFLTISLPPFGLATHKSQGNLWYNADMGDDVITASLFRAASSWLWQICAHHQDFNFFTTH